MAEDERSRGPCEANLHRMWNRLASVLFDRGFSNPDMDETRTNVAQGECAGVRHQRSRRRTDNSVKSSLKIVVRVSGVVWAHSICFIFVCHGGVQLGGEALMFVVGESRHDG